MTFTIGTKYYVTFDPNSDYATLSEVYEVTGLYTYQQLLDQEIDLVAELYMLTGLYANTNVADTAITTGLMNWTTDTFVRMVGVNNGYTITAPFAIIATADDNITPYYSIMLLVDLGVFDDPAYAAPISSVVNEAIMNALGNPTITDNATLDEIETIANNSSATDEQKEFVLTQLRQMSTTIKVYDKTWLRPSVYETRVEQRLRAKEYANTLSNHTFTNYCKLYLEAQQELIVERAKTAALLQAVEELRATVS